MVQNDSPARGGSDEPLEPPPGSAPVWQCRRGVDARIDTLKDFHLQWKIEYKSGFNGNNYKKV